MAEDDGGKEPRIPTDAPDVGWDATVSPYAYAKKNGIQPQQFYGMAKREGFPQYVNEELRVRLVEHEVDDWLATRPTRSRKPMSDSLQTDGEKLVKRLERAGHEDAANEVQTIIGAVVEQLADEEASEA